MGYKTSSSSQSSLQIKILKRKHQNYAIDLLKPTLRKFEIFEANGLEGIKKNNIHKSRIIHEDDFCTFVR